MRDTSRRPPAPCHSTTAYPVQWAHGAPSPARTPLASYARLARQAALRLQARQPLVSAALVDASPCSPGPAPVSPVPSPITLLGQLRVLDVPRRMRCFRPRRSRTPPPTLATSVAQQGTPLAAGSASAGPASQVGSNLKGDRLRACHARLVATLLLQGRKGVSAALLTPTPRRKARRSARSAPRCVSPPGKAQRARQSACAPTGPSRSMPIPTARIARRARTAPCAPAEIRQSQRLVSGPCCSSCALVHKSPPAWCALPAQVLLGATVVVLPLCTIRGLHGRRLGNYCRGTSEGSRSESNPGGCVRTAGIVGPECDAQRLSRRSDAPVARLCCRAGANR